MSDLVLTKENFQELGKLPLHPNHPCFQAGHAMYSVYTAHNHQSSFGYHKCSRCGYEENWQYDYVYSNPMYKND